jgi:hypothetical protein
MEVQLFQYAVILQPKRDKDGELTEDGRVIVEPTTVLAKDQKQAELLAGRAIPDEQIKNLERLVVVVRPF